MPARQLGGAEDQEPLLFPAVSRMAAIVANRDRAAGRCLTTLGHLGGSPATNWSGWSGGHELSGRPRSRSGHRAAAAERIGPPLSSIAREGQTTMAVAKVPPNSLGARSSAAEPASSDRAVAARDERTHSRCVATPSDDTPGSPSHASGGHVSSTDHRMRRRLRWSASSRATVPPATRRPRHDVTDEPTSPAIAVTQCNNRSNGSGARPVQRLR